MNLSKTPEASFNRPPLLSSTLSPITRLIIYAGIAFFILSLLFISFFTSGEDIKGIWLFLIGWMGLIIFQFSWFANPLNLLALLLISHRPYLALALSILAFILASQALIFSEIPIGINHEKIFIKELGLGFYFWYLAQGLFLFGIAVETIIQAQKNGD